MKASGQGGQAVVEYILMLLLVFTVVATIAIGFRKSIFKVWVTLTREVAAACPSCPKDNSQIR